MRGEQTINVPPPRLSFFRFFPFFLFLFTHNYRHHLFFRCLPNDKSPHETLRILPVVRLLPDRRHRWKGRRQNERKTSQEFITCSFDIFQIINLHTKLYESFQTSQRHRWKGKRKAKRKENLARIHHLFFRCLPNNKSPYETLRILPVIRLLPDQRHRWKGRRQNERKTSQEFSPSLLIRANLPIIGFHFETLRARIQCRRDS